MGPVIAVVLVMLLAAVTLVVAATVVESLGRTLREALGNDGIAIVFYGFTLITLVAVLKMLTQRGG